MKRKNSNIITDEDITLTSYENQDKTLSEALSEQKQEIEKLKSNVKFIYKYGGIGSGSGSGGGSGTSWQVVITRLDTGVNILPETTLNLSGPGDYGFSVQIYNGGISTFKVTYNWVNSKGSQQRTEVVGVNEGFNSRKSLTLDKNEVLSITVLNQDTQVPVVYNIPFITTSYTFELFYVNRKTKTRVTPLEDNIYMNDVKDDGLMAALSYSTAVNVSKAIYSYIDWDGISHTIDSDDPEVSQDLKIKGETTDTIYLELSEDIIAFLSNNENAKYAQFPLNIELYLEDSAYPENIDTLYLKTNLIPSTIYLKIITSAGSLYDTEQEIYPESGKFNLGSAVFQLTPYKGPLSATRKYNLEIKLNGFKVETDVTTLSDQVTQSVSVPISEPNMEQIIQFTIINGSDVYSKSYYIYTKEILDSFSWYPINIVKNSSYYRRSIESNISNLEKNKTILMTINSNKVSYNFVPSQLTDLNGYDQLLCLGFQYSEINDFNIPIASFNTNNNYGSIFVFQDKILVYNSTSPIPADLQNIGGDTREIFLPTSSKLNDSSDGYHLLTIYKRLEFKKGNNYYKSIYIYLDGILEGVFKVMTTEHFPYTSISFYPGNYYINLIESSYFEHTPPPDTVSLENYLENYTWLEDNDIVGYNYAYKEKLLGINCDSEMNLYNSFKTFIRDSDNYIHTTDTAIENIAGNSKIPTIVLHFTDNGNGIGQHIGYGVDNFKEWMEVSHAENDTIEVVNVTVQWSTGNGSNLGWIKHGTELASFRITMQGSSTLGYRCKNWELMAPERPINADHTCIYSPNFIPVTDNMDNEAKKEAYNSFLPEESFTLKADVVDSSHTNNNAMGNFINRVTTQFSDSVTAQNNSNYKNYVKNCLTGFPILVFLHTQFKSDPGEQEASNNNYYFLGIYNFNLGRKSYFNLGYKNTSVLRQLNLQSGFKIYELPNNDNLLLNGIMVGEVQGNDEHFDFSQYDASILFQYEDTSDITYMFGDFVGINTNDVKARIKEFVKQVAFGGGYVFKQVGKNFSEELADRYGYANKYSAVDQNGIPKNQVPNYMYQAFRDTTNNYTYTKLSNEASQTNLTDLILQDPNNTDHKPILNYKSLCEYYTTCMAFGLVDSVQKNLNIKSWDGGKSFYIAFYDMDTCLGVSNAGTRISYFAFSDYWKSTSDENNRLEPVKIYRDYSPINTAGTNQIGESMSSFFDVPSSYLFAIAKYAYFILPTTIDNRVDLVLHPSNIWAKWRQKNQISGDSQAGCLSSADYFMQTYYNHHLDNVPVSAFNYNYRYKYFVIDKDTNKYDNINFPKFYGRKQAYTRDWVNGRFHILDAYFNINGVLDKMGIPDNNGNYPYDAPMAQSDYVDSNNPDIYVLKDIFSSSSQGNQYASLDYDVVVKARPYAPLVLKGTNRSSRYIFPQEPTNCIINLSSSGNQYVLFGGSSLWTELDTINPFITQDYSLTINSNYFTTLTGNAGICSSWSINTPSLKNITLRDNYNFSNLLEFSSLEEDNKFPNLQSVVIDDTNLKLKINRSTLTEVSALEMNSLSSLEIENVSMLTSLAISGYMSKLSIPAWKSEVVLPTTYSSTNTSAYFSCPTITITNDPIKYINNTLKIINNDALTELTFSGFETVIIENCPNLQTININDGETKYLKNLYVDMLRDIINESGVVTNKESIANLDSFTIGSKIGTVDLSNSTSLENIKLAGCPMTTVILPKKEVNLVSEAFRACNNLVYLETYHPNDPNEIDDEVGTYYIKGESVFRDCPNFTMLQKLCFSEDENGKRIYNDVEQIPFSDLVVSSETTTLANTFYINNTNLRGSIDLITACHFLDICCKDASSVTTIANLFNNQNISYTKDKFIEEYFEQEQSPYSSLKLNNFPNCYNLTKAFYNNPIDAYNRYMFVGLNATNINFTNVIGEEVKKNPRNNEQDHRGYEKINPNSSTYYHVVYATEDFLAEIINKISTLSLRVYGASPDGDNLYMYFLEKEEDEEIPNQTQIGLKSTISLHDIFNPTVENILRYPEKLTSFHDFEVFPGHTIDFSNWFNPDPESNNHPRWSGSSTISIYSVFRYGTYSRVVNNSLEGLLKPLNLSSISTFLVNISGYIERVDMFNFLDWNNISSTTNLFYNSSGKSLGFNKKLTYDQFQNIWEKILGTTKLTSIASLFENCDIDISGSYYDNVFRLVKKNIEISPNTKITTTRYLFRGCRLMSNTSPTSFNIQHDFLKYLPSLKVVERMFENTYWKHTIPFDFFNKRRENPIISIYVDYLGSKHKANLHTFYYSRDITNFRRCFANITLENIDSFNETDEYNNGSVVRNYIRRVDDNNQEIIDEEYTEYYSNIEDDAPIILTQPQEIQDLDELKKNKETYNDYISYYAKIRDYGSEQISNYSLQISYTGFFVSPDVFYGSSISQSADIITECFSANSVETETAVFTGIIPQHFLYSIGSANIKDLLYNINILPFKFAQYSDLNSIDPDLAINLNNINKTIKCYKFVPSGYINSDSQIKNLTGAFTFKLLIPPATSNDDNEEVWYYILTPDSIRTDTELLANAFPITTSTMYNHIFNINGTYPYYHSSDLGIRFNIMGTQIKITQEFDENLYYSSGQFVKYNNKYYMFIEPHIAGTAWDDNQVLDPIEENLLMNDIYKVDPGLNVGELTSLYLDNIFDPYIMAITYGPMFTNNTYTWKKLKTNSNYCAKVGYSSVYSGISYNLKSRWPINNNHFIYANNSTSVKKLSIINFNTITSNSYSNINFVD